MAEPRKYTFDTVFDWPVATVTSPYKRLFGAD